MEAASTSSDSVDMSNAAVCTEPAGEPGKEGTAAPETALGDKRRLPQCYIWGSVDWENWDQNKLVLQFPTPFTALNDLNLSIKQVSSGTKHTMIVTTDGKVFAFGSNAKGQLGVDLAYTYSPVPILPGKGPWAEAACGVGHTLIRSVDGKVFSFGANVFGQLGHTSKTKQTVPIPTRVTGEIEFSNVVQIAAGGDTSYALTDDGSLYAWGAVAFGALGTGTNGEHLEKAGKLIYDDEEKPVRVSWFNDHKIKVQKVAAGLKHVLVLSSDRKLYTFGHGAYGRLGQGNDAHDKVWPVPITWYTRKEIEVQDIWCGAEHSVCTAKMGEHVFVYFWGRPGNEQNGVMSPISVDSLCGQGVCSISAGRGMTMACTEQGEVAIWGENSACSNLGLLGLQKNKRMEPKVLDLLVEKHIVSLSCGHWHMMAFADPERSKGEAMLQVPLQGREIKTGGFVSATKTPWEEVVKVFEAKCKETPPKAVIEPKSTSAQPAAKKRKVDALQKLPKGPLKVGTKLQAWFEDVYVKGTITQKTKGKNKYLVSWDREGWKDEEVELKPEDHTTDETNPDRWQLI